MLAHLKKIKFNSQMRYVERTSPNIDPNRYLDSRCARFALLTFLQFFANILRSLIITREIPWDLLRSLEISWDPILTILTTLTLLTMLTMLTMLTTLVLLAVDIVGTAMRQLEAISEIRWQNLESITLSLNLKNGFKRC